MKPTPAKLGMMYLVLVLVAASLRGCWEWSYSNFNGDPDGKWAAYDRRSPIWTPPTAGQIRLQLDKSSEKEFKAAMGDGLIIRHDWTMWSAGVLIVIFPAFILLKWFGGRSVRADWKLRFLLTSMTGVYGGMILWFVVWMCTAWRPPSIFPYCGIGLVIGVVVATVRRQATQWASNTVEATADQPYT